MSNSGSKGMWKDGHISLLAATKRLGMSRFSVMKLAALGELKGEVIAGRMVVTIASLERYLERRRSGAA